MKLIGIVSFLLALFACRNTQKPQENTTFVDSLAQSNEYFPVVDYLKSEIRDVDSLPVAITKYTTQNNQTDSAYIKSAEFHQLAKEFLADELTKDNFQKNYSENSFFDQTTQSSTFTYATKNNNLEVQRVDVVSKARAVYDKVKSIYMERIINRNDSLIVKKLFWIAGKNFLIITEKRGPSGTPEVSQVKVVWNYWE